jgi:hypothetical protein
VRSRKREELHCEILEGHMSTALCQRANIAFRTGRKPTFDPAIGTFPGGPEANTYLTRTSREPYVVPDRVEFPFSEVPDQRRLHPPQTQRLRSS